MKENVSSIFSNKVKKQKQKIIYINITFNSTENNGFKSWCHWTPGADEQGLEIHNILQCVWKQRNTFFFFSFLLVWYPMKMGKILRWGIQRRMSSRNRNTSEKISTAVNRRKLSNKNILAHFVCHYPSERESRETEKNRVKQKGSQTNILFKQPLE